MLLTVRLIRNLTHFDPDAGRSYESDREDDTEREVGWGRMQESCPPPPPLRRDLRAETERKYRLLISSWRKREAQAMRPRMMDAVALISPRTGTPHHTLHRHRSAPAVVQSRAKEVRIKDYVKYG